MVGSRKEATGAWEGRRLGRKQCDNDLRDDWRNPPNLHILGIGEAEAEKEGVNHILYQIMVMKEGGRRLRRKRKRGEKLISYSIKY